MGGRGGRGPWCSWRPTRCRWGRWGAVARGLELRWGPGRGPGSRGPWCSGWPMRCRCGGRRVGGGWAGAGVAGGGCVGCKGCGAGRQSAHLSPTLPPLRSTTCPLLRLRRRRATEKQPHTKTRMGGHTRAPAAARPPKRGPGRRSRARPSGERWRGRAALSLVLGARADFALGRERACLAQPAACSAAGREWGAPRPGRLRSRDLEISHTLQRLRAAERDRRAAPLRPSPRGIRPP